MESNIIFSKKFRNLLQSINSNYANKLLRAENRNYEVTTNFIDVVDKETASFLPDTKYKQLSAQPNTERVVVVDEGRYFPRWSHMFKELDFKNKEENGSLPNGTEGTIMGRGRGIKNPNIECVKIVTDSGIEALYNIEGVRVVDGLGSIVWSKYRNTMRIGRLLRGLLSAIGENASDRDIEILVNQYKAYFDVLDNKLLQFDVVSGDDIAHWYNYEQYQDRENGTLGNSCMKNMDHRVFDIYTKNPTRVQLLILYSDYGKVIADDLFTPAKYTSTTIRGRALIWHTNQGIKFMDRVYTNNDSDIELFKLWATKNSVYYKENQDSGDTTPITNGVEAPRYKSLSVDLKKISYDKFPYMDTMKYFDGTAFSSGSPGASISNDSDSGWEVKLEDTGGSYSETSDDDDNDY